MTTLSSEDYQLIGIAVIAAQKLEFGLYGIVSHLTHLPEFRGTKRFRDLNPSDFLSSDPGKKELRKATLGQVAKAIQTRALLPQDALEAYVAKRNLLVHEYWREVVSEKGTSAVPNPRQFLLDFTKETELWTSAIKGPLSLLQEAAARKEGRLGELRLLPTVNQDRQAYYSLVELHLARDGMRATN